MLLEQHQLETIEDIELFFKNNAISVELKFQFSTTKEWLLSWLTNYIRNQDRLFFTFHTFNGLIVAIYPLYLKKILFGYELRFIGTGEPEYAEVYSEFQDFIINPDYVENSLTLFSKKLENTYHINTIHFERVLESSICSSWIKTADKLPRYLKRQLAGYRYIMDVYENDELQISALKQKTIRRYARRFLENKEITINYCLTESQLKGFFTALIQLHEAQWQKRGKTGAFTSDKFRHFHHTFAEAMLKQNKLLVFSIQYKSQITAVYYGFYHENILYYYQSGVSTSSPLLNTGSALHLTALFHARAKGAKLYDLMTGGEDDYKRDYIKAGELVLSLKRTNLLGIIADKAAKIKLS